jgi:hypothetical protein
VKVGKSEYSAQRILLYVQNVGVGGDRQSSAVRIHVVVKEHGYLWSERESERE